MNLNCTELLEGLVTGSKAEKSMTIPAMQWEMGTQRRAVLSRSQRANPASKEGQWEQAMRPNDAAKKTQKKAYQKFKVSMHKGHNWRNVEWQQGKFKLAKNALATAEGKASPIAQRPRVTERTTSLCRSSNRQTTANQNVEWMHVEGRMPKKAQMRPMELQAWVHSLAVKAKVKEVEYDDGHMGRKKIYRLFPVEP